MAFKIEFKFKLLIFYFVEFKKFKQSNLKKR